MLQDNACENDIVLSEKTSEEYAINKFSANSSDDSDEELQMAFREGRLKPGLNIETSDQSKQPNIFNSKVIGQKLNSLYLDLPWLERLDISVDCSKKTNNEIQASPDVLSTIDQTEHGNDLADDDIKRELCIMNQAKMTILEAIPRLQKLKVPVQRPTDYFAEMAKSDIHMAKVTQRLQERISSVKEKQRLKQLRQLKKHGKQTQIIAEQQKLQEKRELGELLKKNKKGDKTYVEQFKQKLNASHTSKKRHKLRKSSKYGNGGRKKGSKVNTAASSAGLRSTKIKGKRGTFNKSARKRNAQTTSSKKQSMKTGKRKR